MNTALKKTQTRDIDPNVLQRRASTPESSVWVSASAGSGKTKVLTDRVLRLLLPRENGAPGSPAHKILCLTFTKAGANEMALRITNTLRRWAVMEDKELQDALKNLFGRAPKTHEIIAAKRLFADVVDVPGGLKIMTIHAFCQSILGRFPLEAGVSPQFRVLEDFEAQTLMSTALTRILDTAENEKATPLGAALSHIARTINEDQFLALLNTIASERNQLQRILKTHFDIDGLYTSICQTLRVPPAKTTQDILIEISGNEHFAHDDLLRIARAMVDRGGKNDQKYGQIILSWLELTPPERAQNFDTYITAYLTTKFEARSKTPCKAVCEAHPDAIDIFTNEAQRLLGIRDQILSMNIATLTRDIITLGDTVLKEYAALKTAQGVLDFDDLILRTSALLNGSSMNMNAQDTSSWIHYKLDQGLDHILIDEAQDTNPEQWNIISALADEFFINALQPSKEVSDTTRTVFTVGDEKQSIYSFQRASPEEFERMQNDFANKAATAQQRWDAVPMNISFRSVRCVLETVDAVFANPLARKGLGALPIEHSAYRRGQGGITTLWPLFESDEPEELELWKPLTEGEETLSGQKKLADHIAGQIKNWLENDEILESKSRPVRPGDIMILVRTRSALVKHIARALKNANIPVSGLDRMMLTDELAVQDIIAACEWALQPRDDLTLATLLKSPFIGMDEETLFILAYNRENESLWERVKASEHTEIKNWLQNLRQNTRAQSPFTFLANILQSPCPADPISARRALMTRLGKDAMNPLDELLNIARNFEQNENASLQNFLHAQRSNTQEIKREQSEDDKENAGEVRIMTVHGSKGLQAPIVILPDTTSMNTGGPIHAGKRLLWPQQTGLSVLLWAPRSDAQNAAYTAAMGTLHERLEEEYRRLLYVAMTRAEDRLYIGGALGRKKTADKIPEGCWYNLIKTGLESLDDTKANTDGTLSLSTPQIHDPDKPQAPVDSAEQTPKLPAWINTPASPESNETQIHRPSQMDDTALSPLQNAGTHRFIRGNLTHTLLQFLPELPNDQWENAAHAYLKRYSANLAEDTRQDISRETLAVLQNDEFSALFGPQSMAEVPITGKLGDKLISGQIDRLVITDTEVLIIDYKTNRPPPDTADKIPQIYRDQMQTYADVLHQIYPNHTIKGALLWTDGPHLMPLDL